MLLVRYYDRYLPLIKLRNGLSPLPCRSAAHLSTLGRATAGTRAASSSRWAHVALFRAQVCKAD